MKPFDDVKLLLFIGVGFVLLAFLAFASRHRHPHTLPTVEIAAEPSPLALPTSLPRPSVDHSMRSASTPPLPTLNGRDAGD